MPATDAIVQAKQRLRKALQRPVDAANAVHRKPGKSAQSRCTTDLN